MGAINWNTFDLNLLVVFEAVMQERNLTRAGRRLGMSQPAVSHALARLRHLLKDELFIRAPEGMQPTPRAERMAGPLRAALQELQLTLAADEFDAAKASRSFAIAANNYAARAVIPALIAHVAAEAPSVVLDIRPVGRLHVLDQLDEGSVELALSALEDGGERFKCARLLEDDYVAVFSRENPIGEESDFSIERFAALPHVAITSSGDDAHFIDDALAERGLARLIFAKAPLHSLVSVLLISSKAIAVTPRGVAADLIKTSPLAMRSLPFASARFALSMIWHRRVDNHPAHRWLRAKLRAVVNQATRKPLGIFDATERDSRG